MKKLKIILFSIVAIFSFFFAIVKVNAATLYVNITQSSSKVVVGNTVTYTVTISSSELLGSLQYNFSYDSSKLTLISGTLNAAPVFDGTKKSATYTFKFRAKASGTATVKFNIYQAVDWNFNNFKYTSTTTKSTTIITQAELEASYSKNNYLSSLKIDGYSISPSFNKNTNNYSLTVENDVKTINITGSKEDSKSTVSGLGKHDLEEGLNKINVVVTAQNGSSRTYTLNVTVKELTPIIVNVDNKEFSVVRKKELLEKPNTIFEDYTIKLNEEDIPAFINKATDTILIGLKNEDGDIALYIYKDDNYSLYKEFSFDSIIITEATTENIPSGYSETKIAIGNDEITAYKENDNDDFYLFSAVNITTGEENLYQYNKKENTIQIFNKKHLDKTNKDIEELNEQNKNYQYIIIGLGILLIITYIFILISSLRKQKNIKKKNNEKENNIQEDIKINDNLDDQTIEKDEEKEKKLKKIEKVNKEIEKKNKKDGKIKEDISKEQKKKNK